MTKKQANPEPKAVLQLLFFCFGILEQGGGFENSIIETARRLMEHSDSVSVTIITASPKTTERLQHLLSVYFLKKHSPQRIYKEPTSSVRKKLGNARYIHFNNLSELVEEINNSDVIYTKNEVLELSILKLLKKRIHTPMIMGVHTAVYYPYAYRLSDKVHNFLYTGQLYKWLIKDMGEIKVNTTEDKRYMTEKFGIKNVRIVHSAFDLKVGRQVKNKARDLHILFVGRITEQKGINKLIEIIQGLSSRDEFKSLHFKIAGDGEELLVKNIEALALEFENVEYLGHIENSKIGAFYDWADVTLIPSYWETLNWVAAETAVAGKVAICTDIPGPREIIIDKKTGFLVPLNVKAFIEKIIEVLNLKKTSPNTLYKMGLSAQKRVLEEFNPDKVYGEFDRQLLSNYKGNRPKA